MKKRFEFKLAPVLKLRKYKQKNAEFELGKVNRRIEETIDDIDKRKSDIELFQSELNKNPTMEMIKYFTGFIYGHEGKIKSLQEELRRLYEDQKEKIEILSKAKADSEILENMKEDKLKKFKKDYQKQVDLEIEENFLIMKRGAR